jgi:hypothetical protein
MQPVRPSRAKSAFIAWLDERPQARLELGTNADGKGHRL